jgi:hypothetical protein
MIGFCIEVDRVSVSGNRADSLAMCRLKAMPVTPVVRSKSDNAGQSMTAASVVR